MSLPFTISALNNLHCPNKTSSPTHSPNKTPSPTPPDAEIDLKHADENLKPYFAKPSIEQIAAVKSIKETKRKLVPKLPDELIKQFASLSDQTTLRELLTIEIDLAELFDQLYKDLKETASIEEQPYLTGSRSRQVLRGLSAMDTDITWYVTHPIFAQVKEAFSKFLFGKLQQIKKRNPDLLLQKALTFIVQNVKKIDRNKPNAPVQTPVSDLYFTKMQTETLKWAIYGLEACDIKFVCPKAITDPTSVALTDSFHISFKDGAIGCRYNNEWCNESNFVLACSRLDNRQLVIESPEKYTDLILRILIDMTRYGFVVQSDTGRKEALKSAIGKFEAKSKDADQNWYKKHLGNHYRNQTGQITDCLNFLTIAKDAYEEPPEKAHSAFRQIAANWPFSQCVPIAEMMGSIQKHPHMTEHFLNVVHGLFFFAWTKQSPEIAAYTKLRTTPHFCIGKGDDQCYLNVAKNPVEMTIAFLKSWQFLEDQALFSKERPCAQWIQELAGTIGLTKILPPEINRNSFAESLIQAFVEPSPLKTALEYLSDGNLSPVPFYQYLLQSADPKHKQLLEIHILNYDLQRYSKEASRLTNSDAVKWVKGLTLSLQGFFKEQNATATEELFQQIPQMLSSTDPTFKKLLNRCIQVIMNKDSNQALTLIEQCLKKDKEFEAIQKEFLEFAVNIIINLQKDKSHKTSLIAVQALKTLVQNPKLRNPTLEEGCLNFFKSISKEQLKKKKFHQEIVSIINQLIAPECLNLFHSAFQWELLTVLHQLGFGKQVQKAWSGLLQQPDLSPTAISELCNKALDFNFEDLFEQVFPMGLKSGNDKLIVRLFEEGMAKLGIKFIALLRASSSHTPSLTNSTLSNQSQALLSVKFMTFLTDQLRTSSEAAQKRELKQAINSIGMEAMTFLTINGFAQERTEVFKLMMTVYQPDLSPESLLQQGKLLLQNSDGNTFEIIINFIQRFIDNGIHDASNELMEVALEINKKHLSMLISSNHKSSIGQLLNNFIETQIKLISSNRTFPKKDLAGILNSIRFLNVFSPQYARLFVERVFETWENTEAQNHREHIAILDECDKNQIFNESEFAKWRLDLEYHALDALFRAQEEVSEPAIQRLNIAHGFMNPYTEENFSDLRKWVYQIFIRVLAEAIISHKFNNLKKFRLLIVNVLTKVIKMSSENKSVYAPLFSQMLELLIHVLTYYPSMKNMLVESLSVKAINKPLLPLLHQIILSKQYSDLHKECFQNSIFRSATLDETFAEWICMFNDESSFRRPIGQKTKHEINEILIQLMQLILHPSLTDRKSKYFGDLQESLSITHSLLVYTGVLPEQIAEFEKILCATDPSKQWREVFAKSANFLFASNNQIHQANSGNTDKKKQHKKK